ncbi:MAG: nucleotide exchange factor GrpE [Bacteroidota bacterium]
MSEEKKTKDQPTSAKTKVEDESPSVEAMADEGDKEVPVKKTTRKSRKKASPKKKDKDAEKLEELGRKLEEMNDKHLRLFSEFDNFRKRTQKEKLELYKTASEDVMLALLPVLDDFERALKAVEDNGADENHKEGIELIYNKFHNTLKQKGLESLDSMGKEFDTDFHEAITKIPAPEPDMKGMVVDVIEKGYKLNDKVIRFAKVVVGS